MSKFEKDEVNYGRGMIHSHCGKAFEDDKSYCRHYEPRGVGVGTCEIVEGPIGATMWCEKFKRISNAQR